MRIIWIWLALIFLTLTLAGCVQVSTTQATGPEAPDAATPLPPTVEQPDTPTPGPMAETPLPTSTAPAEETPEAAAGSESGGAANADVTHVRAVQGSNEAWTFYVTVSHPDTGWEDYADGWDVVTPDGTVLKPDPDSPFTRLLLHPHVDEQPFTRSQGNIQIPAGVTQVTVRAHDLVDGFGGQEITVDLSQTSGQNFEIERAS